MLHYSIALIESYSLIYNICYIDEIRLIWTRSSFRVLKISTRVFSLPFGRLVLCLIWRDSPDLGLSNNGKVKFIALGLEGRRGGEGTRFRLLRPSWRDRIWTSLRMVNMVGMGSRSSFEWWYFQEDGSCFEFSFYVLVRLLYVYADKTQAILKKYVGCNGRNYTA
jgi:hypothetical protein